VSQGKTRGEAIENIREAIRLYIATLEEDNLPFPRLHNPATIDLRG
jgi:predicted RNase H-like HicB family nuclease